MSNPKHFNKEPNRSKPFTGLGADFRQAVDLEDAARAINQINARTRRDGREAQASMREDYARRKITLPSIYDAWLKKEIPE